MQVNCSNCNSNYSLTGSQIKGLKQSVLTCKKCYNYIKITFCPYCRSFYSITFTHVEHRYYNMKCRKCFKLFKVDFPLIRNSVVNNNDGILKGDSLSDKEKITKSVSSYGSYESTSKTFKSNGTASVEFKGKTLNSFNVKELFSICFSSFSISKLIVASIGISLIVLSLFAFDSFEAFIISFFDIDNSRNFRSFMNIFPAAIVFFLFILTSSLISGITMEKIFFNGKWSIKRTFNFISKVWFSVFVSNIFLLLLFNSMLVIFANIPVVGPVLFSILFLPIYVISFIVSVLIALGFWFYPPIVAYRSTGIAANTKNFYHFLKKHNFTLLYIVPILTIVSGLILSGIYILHHGALSFINIISAGITGENIVKTFSSIPVKMLKLSEISFLTNDMTLYKSLSEGFFINHQIGGFIIGMALIIISMLLFASFISITGTLSSHIYILMERGADIDDSKKLRLLTILVLILLGIFLFKKIFI